MTQLQYSGTGRPLKNSAWGMERLGYIPGKQRSAFWQFCKANGVPMVRTGPRRIMFDPVTLESWLASRATNGRAA